ncbi:MAG TPA: NAD(P)/FAD-dependent oxidoreductase [Fimbriiglobus sp.]
MTRPDVVIVGAGLAGLACGKRLTDCGTSFQIVEAADAVGGRCRTDVVDGYRLDRGFPFYLTASPEGRRVLDYEALELKPYARKALVRFAHLCHPTPSIKKFGWFTTFLHAFSRWGSLNDKFRTSQLISRVARDSFESIDTRDDRPAIDLLRHAGLGPKIIDRYFRPFLSSFLLERDLSTSSRYLRFVLKGMLEGEMGVPARGMQAIPDQVHAKLPVGSVCLNSPVERLEPGTVVLKSDERIEARAVVVATDGVEASRLLEGAITAIEYRGLTKLYYEIEISNSGSSILFTNGENSGPINHLSLQRIKDRPGGMLAAANVLGIPDEADKTLIAAVRNQLNNWLEPHVKDINLLRIYRIPNALPDMSVGKLDPWRRPVRIRPGLYVCGDHRDQGGINGALESGFRAAQAVMEDLAEKRT